MNIQTKPVAAVRHEAMRIAGKRVETDEQIEVRNPYDGTVVGTVPAARPEHVREAFAKASAFKPKLTRYERQQILLHTADLLARPQGGVRPDHHGGVRPVLEGLALRGGPRLRRLFLRRPAHHPGRRRDLFLRHLPARQAAQDLHHARCRCIGVISAITPFNHPLNMVSHKLAPAIATNNRVVLKPTELTPLTALALADVLYEAGLPPEMLSVVTGNPSTMGDAMITDPGLRPRSPSPARSGSASTSPTRPAIAASCWSSAATIR